MGAGAGIKLGPKASPSRVTDSDVGRAEAASLFLLRFPTRSRWPDGSDAPSPLNCCRGSVGGLFAFGEFRTDFVDEILTLDHELGHWVALVG